MNAYQPDQGIYDFLLLFKIREPPTEIIIGQRYVGFLIVQWVGEINFYLWQNAPQLFDGLTF